MLLFAGASLSFSAAQTVQTRAQLTTTVNANFADNVVGAITPALARATYLNMVASSQLINATGVGDAAYPMVAGDRYVYTTAAFSAARIWTLPAASALNKGETIHVADAAGGVTSVNTLSIARNGTDTINGGTASLVLNTAKGGALFVTDGVSNWGAWSPFASNALAFANIAQIGANTVLSNWTSGTANIAANSWPSCSTGNSALQYTTNTGLSCYTSMASLAVADQTLAGGANVTSLTQSTGSLTIDCGLRPLQYITNGGAWTLTAPANDGSCILLVTNNASAGTITFSGFSVGANTGDALTTTNTHKFSLHIWRVNGISGYRVAAHQ